MSTRTWAAILLMACVPTIGQRARADDAPIDQVGPQIGERVPQFTLRDQSGRDRTLQSLMGPNGLVLVFFRSADW